MIRPITGADIPAVLAILEISIGPGWVTGPDLRPGPSRRVVVAETGGAVAGVGSAGVRSWHDAVPSDPEARSAVLAFAGAAPRTVVYLEVAAVDPAARGRGLYTALLRDRIDWARAAGATLLLSMGWTPPDGCHIAPAMTHAGFTELARTGGLYRRPGIPEDARCLVCGSPCDCDAVLFGRLVAPA